MDILKQITSAIDYTEQNLCGEIDFDKIAKIACVTQDSFMRFFSYMTGMSLKEYIRRRRMTLAAFDLQNSDDKIIDIAVKYGYESGEAFSRAFFKQHHKTPTDIRRFGGTIRIYPPISFEITVKGAREMEFKLEKVPQIEIYGVSEMCDDSDHFEFEHIMWAENEKFVPKLISDDYNGVWYGMWSGNKYFIGRTADKVKTENLEKQIIPSETYAVFVSEKGGYAGVELPKLREQIFDLWLPTSGYRQKENFEIEVYHLCNSENRANRYYEIRIPVEKRLND